jgi:vancomycin resistance protein YoaR
MFIAAVGIGAVLVSIVGLGLGWMQLEYRDQIFPGVRVWGVDLSGMSQVEAAEAVRVVFDYPNQKNVVLRYQEQSWTLSPAEMGITFDLNGTIHEAYRLGRSGSFAEDVSNQWLAWLNGVDIAPKMTYNEAQAQQVLSQISMGINRNVVDASLQLNGLDVTITPSEKGVAVNIPQTLALLQAPFVSLSSVDVPLVVEEFSPAVLDTEEQAAKAREILSQVLEVGVAEPLPDDPAPWQISQEQLAQWLRIYPVQDGPYSAHYAIGLDTGQLRTFLDDIKEELAVEPENPRLSYNPDTQALTVLRPAVRGRVLNVEQSIQVIQEQLLAGSHSIPLQFDFEEPAVLDTTTAAELGLTELVARQSTYFQGSSQERIDNITAGATNTNGFLVAPGEVFSFSDAVGDVSLENGFSEALIIFGGRTIKGVGGGICQVSTTVFRTAFFGGFPIVERNAHAYRVGYYEYGNGQPGLDAAVFTPVVDLKFQNNLESWLLIEVYVDVPGRIITYSFYGTGDGREVTVSKPEVTNQKQPPAALYVENSALANGEIKQVDYSAVGADVEVKRVVKRGNEVVLEDRLRTHYEPWQAVYEFGPGTKLPQGAVVKDENSN